MCVLSIVLNTLIKSQKIIGVQFIVLPSWHLGAALVGGIYVFDPR